MSSARSRLEHHQRHLSNHGRQESGTIHTVFTKNAAPPAGPYNQAFIAAGQIFCSGQLPTNPDGEMVCGSITEKTQRCIQNLKAILEEAGSEIGKVVKVVIFLSDMRYFQEFNSEYAKWFPQKPARSCVAVKALPKNADVEIEAVAIL
ncbi:hypothetical protein ABEF93_002038 [Exophiala dermatitidis]